MTPPPAYSILMYENTDLVGTVLVQGPGPGYKWVVVDMFWWVYGTPKGIVYVTAAGGAALFYQDMSQIGGNTVQWTGRQVLATGVNMDVHSDVAAQVRICGYQLSVT